MVTQPSPRGLPVNRAWCSKQPWSLAVLFILREREGETEKPASAASHTCPNQGVTQPPDRESTCHRLVYRRMLRPTDQPTGPHRPGWSLPAGSKPRPRASLAEPWAAPLLCKTGQQQAGWGGSWVQSLSKVTAAPPLRGEAQARAGVGSGEGGHRCLAL